MINRLNAGYFPSMVAGTAVFAWAALFWLHGTSAGHHMHGHGAASLLVFGERMVQSPIEWVVLFLAGWLLMTVAMMLPTTLPLVNQYRRMTRGRVDQGGMLTLLLSGYLCIWVVFGFILAALYTALNRWLPSLLLSDETRWLGPAFFVIAGIFQFLPIKRRCLDRCHSPVDPDSCRWLDSQPLRSSFSLGIRHGLSCVGCCWALMLLMFAAGSAHLTWMLVLTAAIVVEKNLPWGRQLAKPMGVILLSCATLFVRPW